MAPVSKDEPADELGLFGSFYKVGPNVGSISYSFNVADRVASVRAGGPNDLDGILQSIRAGKQTTDFMVVAIHCHQNSFAYQAYSHDNHVPDFLVELAHKSIDAGADVFVGHGVHTIRGVEIYKGKPIFYGVGNFLFPQGAVGTITNGRQGPASVASQTGQPENREALLTTSRYEGGKLVEVRIYPAGSRARLRPDDFKGRAAHDPVTGQRPEDPQGGAGRVEGIRDDDRHRQQRRRDSRAGVGDGFQHRALRAQEACVLFAQHPKYYIVTSIFSPGTG